MSKIQHKRLAKEIQLLATSPPPGVQLLQYADMSCIQVSLTGAEGTLYQGETFHLQFRFGESYPMEAPEVIFLSQPTPIPVHPHIYANGHICLSILYDQWSPALTVSSVCLSILSMLSSCTKKERPPDNDRYVLTHRNKSPKNTQWWFHDDKA